MIVKNKFSLLKKSINNQRGKRFLKLFCGLILQILCDKSNIVIWGVFQDILKLAVILKLFTESLTRCLVIG